MLGLGLNIFTLAIRRYFGGGGGQFAGSSLNLDFTSGNQSLDPRITFTRASTGTRINASGVLVSEAINGPRFDYDPVTLQPKGLLIEEQRTNLLLQSGWAGAVAGSPGTAPTSWSLVAVGSPSLGVENAQYGTADATLALTFNCASAERLWLQQLINVTNGVQYAVSVWAEAVSGSVGAVITISSGTASGTINQPVNSPANPGRYTFLFTANGTGTITIRYGIGTTSPISSPASIRLSRPQVEAGAFPASYIPTTTAAATRAEDVAVMTGANFSNWYRQDEGTFYSDAIGVPGASNVSFVATANDGTSNNFVDAARYQPTLRVLVRVNAATQITIVAGQSAGVYRKAATAFSASDLAFCVNGGVPSTAALTALPVVTRLDIGSDGSVSSRYLNGHIRKIAYFPRRMTNSELQGLTS